MWSWRRANRCTGSCWCAGSCVRCMCGCEPAGGRRFKARKLSFKCEELTCRGPHLVKSRGDRTDEAK